MGARQPVAEEPGGRVRRRAVERHQGRRQARNADDVRAPAVRGDGRNLDEVLLAGDGFLKAMNAQYSQATFRFWVRGARRNLRQRHTAIKRSRPRKDVHSRRVGLLSNARAENIFFVSGGPQDMHRPSTAFPQPAFAAFVVSCSIMRLPPHAALLALLLAGRAAFPVRADDRRSPDVETASRRGRWRDDFPRVSHRRHLARQLRRARPRRRPHRLLDADHRGFRKSAAPSGEPGRRPRRLASHRAVRRCGTGREVLRGQRGSGLRGSHRPDRGGPAARRRHHGSRPAACHRRKGAENPGRVAADPLQLQEAEIAADARHARRDRRRAAGAGRRESSSISTFVPRSETPAPREPLLPHPTPKEMVEQTSWRPRSFRNRPAERVSLLSVALGAIERDADRLPSDWRTETRRRPADDRGGRDREPIASISCSPRAFSTAAKARANAADVRGVERLRGEVETSDGALGRKRPDAVSGLLASLDAYLDSARRDASRARPVGAAAVRISAPTAAK